MHLESKRRERPFVTVNCPTLTEELLASELFGHAGARSPGAVRDQPGRVEAAEGGTLFLDEIGDLPAGAAGQAAALPAGEAVRADRRDAHAPARDVRVVAATNRDLEADVAAGRFREDLLFRLNVIEIRVPPLRERRDDILPLARRFLAFFARAVGRAPPDPVAGGRAVLRGYDWPGNVRELRNAIERAVILWPSRGASSPPAFPERIAGSTRARAPASAARSRWTSWSGRTSPRSWRPAQAPWRRRRPSLGIDDSTLWRKRKRYEDQGPS